MIIDRLYERVKERGPLCTGLDLREEYLPDEIKNSNLTLGEKLFEFNKEIIDATREISACFKIQIACYEALGLEGLKAYANTAKYLREKNELVIGDIKRGDIGSTSKMYAQGHFEGDFEVDMVTLNPYMGEDVVSPYYEYMDKKGVFMLAKTSNESSKDFQDKLLENKKPLYLETLSKIREWGSDFVGESGYSSIGAVVGVNHANELKLIRENADKIFLLIPGYGAQGAEAKDIAYLLGSQMSGVVNVSRGIIKDYDKLQKPWREALKIQAENLRGGILDCLK